MILQKKALELRLRGFTYDDIVDELNIVSHNPKYTPRQMAAKAVRQALNLIKKETKEAAENVRDMEMMRLDELWLALQKKVLQEDTRAVEACLRIQERRAKLMGLDAPAKQIITETKADFNLPDDLAKLNDLEALLTGLNSAGPSSDEWTTDESIAVDYDASSSRSSRKGTEEES